VEEGESHENLVKKKERIWILELFWGRR